MKFMKYHGSFFIFADAAIRVRNGRTYCFIIKEKEGVLPTYRLLWSNGTIWYCVSENYLNHLTQDHFLFF